jgi:formate dehydrogenase subunit gamma
MATERRAGILDDRTAGPVETDRGRRIIRYTFAERIVHSFAALFYVYLLLTGLALWTPALYWIAAVLGGGYLSALLHPWVGLFFTVFLVWMWAMWRGDMRITPEDRAWRKAMGHYVRNEDARVPPAWRFNDGQKAFFWAMAISGILLLLSGFALWFVDSIPWEWRWLRFAAVLVHGVATLVTIAGFIVHLYMGLMVVPGGLHAILHGDVSEEWARTHHLLWYRKLRGQDSGPR